MAASSKYKTYPEYKDSGVEWLGEIPNNWNISPLKFLFKIFNGATPKSGVEEFWDGDINWVTPADFSKLPSNYLFDSNRKITSKGYLSCGTNLVPNNSIILSTRAPIGSIAISAVPLCTNQGCKSLVVNSSANIKYYFYLLSISEKQLNLLGRGTTFLELSTEDLASFNTPIPSNLEQTKIAQFLDHETAKIDQLIEKQQSLIELLKEKRQAVISHAVTKGLDPNVKMKDSGVEWVGNIPENWNVKPVFALFSPLMQKNDNGIESNVLSLSYGRIIQRDVEKNFGLLPESFNTYQIVKQGDIILRLTDLQNDKRSLRVGLVTQRGIITSAYLKLTPQTHITPNFTYFLLHSYDITKVFYSMGGGLRQSMKFEDFRRLPIILPPKNEQIEIAAYLDNQTSKIDLLIQKAEEQIELMKERRTALISAAVTGKIDVRDWQPAQ